LEILTTVSLINLGCIESDPWDFDFFTLLRYLFTVASSNITFSNLKSVLELNVANISQVTQNLENS
jgi:hypothetical protein